MFKISTLILGMVLSTQVFAITNEEVNVCMDRTYRMKIEAKFEKLNSLDQKTKSKLATKMEYSAASSSNCEEFKNKLEGTLNQLESALLLIEKALEIN